MMLVVLFKKTDYNTRCAEIDNKVSSLDGKSAENKTKNVSIENALKGLIKDLYFLLRQIFSLVDQMIIKFI